MNTEYIAQIKEVAHHHGGGLRADLGEMSRQDQGAGNVAHLAECLQACEKPRSPSAMPHKPSCCFPLRWEVQGHLCRTDPWIWEGSCGSTDLPSSLKAIGSYSATLTRETHWALSSRVSGLSSPWGPHWIRLANIPGMVVRTFSSST